MPDDQTPSQNPRGVSRRQFLPGAAGLVAIAAAGVAGYEINNSNNTTPPAKTVTDTATTPGTSTKPTSSATDAGLQVFQTRPDLRPPTVAMANLQFPKEASQPGYIALATTATVPAPDVQSAAMIIDSQGRLIWYYPVVQKSVVGGDPAYDQAFDANVQTYNGKPVLSFWDGKVVDGYGYGAIKVLDEQYKQVGKLDSLEGMSVDLHEFNISSSGDTAFVTAVSIEKLDLRKYGGSQRGRIYVNHAYEVEIATGKILFSWNSLEHVPPDESYVSAVKGSKAPWDYFHLNSIAELDDDHLLISGRSASALYKVDRSSGEIVWRLNGKKSDFKVDAAADFGFQHHVRPVGTGQMTIFDNSALTSLKPGFRSRGMLINFDESSMKVTLAQAFDHPSGFIAQSQGSVQVLSTGNVLVGWGAQPYTSLFSSDGELLIDGAFAQGVRSYRAFAVDWVGRPEGKPAAVAKELGTGGFTIWASWNGATEIDHWDVYAGANAKSLKKVGSRRWTDFETAITVNSSGPSFQAVAVDKRGSALGRSEIL